MAKGEVWYPKAIKRMMTTGEYWPRRIAHPVLAEVKHVSAGKDSRGFLQNTANQSSTHFLIGKYNGKLEVSQFLPIDLVAWGNGIVNVSQYTPAWLKRLIDQGINPNYFTISTEHERVWPYSTAWDDDIIAASIDLSRWLKDTVPTIRYDQDYLLGHFQIDGVNRPFCPGGIGGHLFPFAQIQKAVLDAPGPIIPDNRTAIERFYDSTGGYAEFGPAVEMDSVGRIVEKTIKLPDVPGDPFQVGFYHKGTIVWRKDLGASRYNTGLWLHDELKQHGEL